MQGDISVIQNLYILSSKNIWRQDGKIFKKEEGHGILRDLRFSYKYHLLVHEIETDSAYS